MRWLTGGVAVWLALVGSMLEPIPSGFMFIAAFALAIRMLVLELRKIG